MLPNASPAARPVYPRVGGETVWVWGTCCGMLGLSPRGRGNHQLGDQRERSRRLGSIPAWAGKPVSTCAWHAEDWPKVYPRVGGETHCLLSRTPAPRQIAVYPRVGGGNPCAGYSGAAFTALGLSPRGRGNRL